MKSQTSQMLEVLKGLPLITIGHAADLLWMHFGSLREIKDLKGGKKQVGDWALHVQTNWRFVRESKIVVGQADMYFQAGNCERYDWKAGGQSRFDERADVLNQTVRNAKTVVEGITCDELGGFTLTFEDGYSFEVFPDASSDFPEDELWRLFAPGRDDSHFVVESTGPY